MRPHLVFTSSYPSLSTFDLLYSPPSICQLVKEKQNQNQTGVVTLVLLFLWGEGIIFHLIRHGNQYIVVFQGSPFVGGVNKRLSFLLFAAMLLLQN